MYRALNSLKAYCVLAIMLIIQPALGYEFRVTNATGEDIAVEVYGIPFGSMMRGNPALDGLFPGQKYWEKDFGNTKTINNAGKLNGPAIVPRGHTTVLDFTSWDVGVCFALDQTQVGRADTGFNMTPAKVVALPNEWFDTIFDATQQAGDTVQNVGQAVGKIGEAIPEPRVQAVIGAIAAGTQAVGAVTDIVGKLVRASSCKNMSFVAVRGKNGISVDLLTQQQ